MHERATTLPAATPAVGLEIATHATVDDGAIVRSFRAADHLHGPRGILQGGLATGIMLAAARLADRFDAPATSVGARLRRPTPLDADCTVRVVPTAAARYDVSTWHGDDLLVEGEVELAGHDPAPQVADLQELATLPFPDEVEQRSFPDCWVCGPDNPEGLRLLPRPAGEGRQSIPWIAPEELGDGRGRLDPLVVAAVLDCPTVWASMHHVEAQGHVGALLAGFRVGYFAPAPVLEPLRIVARSDHADGRKIEARSALVDEDGVVYAVASALQISVPEVPTRA